MPFTPLVIAAAIAVGWLRGGRLRTLSRANLRSVALLFTGLALQLLGDLAAGREWITGSLAYLVVLTSQILILAWILRNRRQPGMPLIVVGFALNVVVMALNGAMPVSPDAMDALGLTGASIPPGKHELMTAATWLPWLGDLIPLPGLRTIISLGDLVLAAGVIPLVSTLMCGPVVTVPRRAVDAGNDGRAVHPIG